MTSGERLGPYALVEELGRGPTASTWLARLASPEGPAAGPGGNSEGQEAVLKVLDLSEASSWGAVDVFRREAEALRQLSHPAIPAYVDSFEAQSEGRLRLVIAMERMAGENLEKILGSGRKFSESEIEDMLAQLCDVLAYLGSLRPPIVHRDINPRNLLLRPDGRIALVDFSGVQDAVRTALYPGATLVGTAGYIPLEQVAGRASHRSDLYGAAATAVFLLTGRNPAELPTKALKIDLTGIVDLSPALSAVLSSWLEPDVQRRDLGAAEAAVLLRGGVLPASPAAPVQGAAGEARPRPPQARGDSMSEGLPSDSRVLVERSEAGLRVTIAPGRTRQGSRPLAGFSVFWIGFVAFWTLMTLRMRAPFFFTLFSLPFWGVAIFLARTTLSAALSTRELVLTDEGLSMRTQVLGTEKLSSWPLSDLGRVRCLPAKVQFQGSAAKELCIEAGTGELRLGADLSERELSYLEGLLSEEIGRRKGR